MKLMLIMCYVILITNYLSTQNDNHNYDFKHHIRHFKASETKFDNENDSEYLY